MNGKKDFSLLNCIGSSLLAIFFTVPPQEAELRINCSWNYFDGYRYFCLRSGNTVQLTQYCICAKQAKSSFNSLLKFALVLLLLKNSNGQSYYEETFCLLRNTT